MKLGFLLVFILNFFNCQKSNISIFAFHGVPSGKYSTVSQFERMNKVGINICFTWYNNTNELLTALDNAEKADVKLVVGINELFSNTSSLVNLVKNKPALYGYYLKDEPSPSQFKDLISIIKNIRKEDDKHIVYVNLHPNYAPKINLENLPYENYVNKFINEVPINFLSFDNYPLVNNKVREDWYHNLEVIRYYSAKKNIPFWGFACSAIHYNYLQPSLAGLKLQQFGNLLYGAKGLQYFTYWTLTYEENWVKEKYGYAIVDGEGNPTPTYSIVKKVNEQIQKLAWVFVNSKVEQVAHLGNIPSGTSELKKKPKYFKQFIANGDALVSLLSNKQMNFVVVQNKNIYKDLKFTCNISKNLNIVNNDTGKLVILKLGKHIHTIPPGDILIFAYPK